MDPHTGQKQQQRRQCEQRSPLLHSPAYASPRRRCQCGCKHHRHSPHYPMPRVARVIRKYGFAQFLQVFAARRGADRRSTVTAALRSCSLPHLAPLPLFLKVGLRHLAACQSRAGRPLGSLFGIGDVARRDADRSPPPLLPLVARSADASCSAGGASVAIGHEHQRRVARQFLATSTAPCAAPFRDFSCCRPAIAVHVRHSSKATIAAGGAQSTGSNSRNESTL